MGDNGASRVLVVDDDPAIVRLITLILASEDYVVSGLAGGEEALGALGNGSSPDLVILDLQMPEMDGRTFYKRARERGFAGPVIICSSFGADSAQRELGASGAIAKPFDPDRLISSVKGLLDGT